jgi:hypothetical protein
MCSNVGQEMREGEEVARFVEGSLLNKVRMANKIMFDEKEINKEIISGL